MSTIMAEERKDYTYTTSNNSDRGMYLIHNNKENNKMNNKTEAVKAPIGRPPRFKNGEKSARLNLAVSSKSRQILDILSKWKGVGLNSIVEELLVNEMESVQMDIIMDLTKVDR